MPLRIVPIKGVRLLPFIKAFLKPLKYDLHVFFAFFCKLKPKTSRIQLFQCLFLSKKHQRFRVIDQIITKSAVIFYKKLFPHTIFQDMESFSFSARRTILFQTLS